MFLFTLCYLKQDGKTLMIYRNKKNDDVHEGKWNGLGGKFLPGETPEECVVREVKEESGLDVVSPQLRGVMTFPKFKNDEDWFVFLFTAETFSGQLRDCDEGRLEWISDDKIPELNLWEGDRLFMDWLNRDQFFSAKFLYENKKLINHKVVFYSGG